MEKSGNVLDIIPWQVTSAVVLLAYLAFNIRTWLIVCDTTSMAIGLCGAGKIFVSSVSLAGLVVFALIVFLIHFTVEKKQIQPWRGQKINRFVLVAGMFFVVVPAIVIALIP